MSYALMTCWPNRKPDLNELIKRSFAEIDRKIDALCNECVAPQIKPSLGESSLSFDNSYLIDSFDSFMRELPADSVSRSYYEKLRAMPPGSLRMLGVRQRLDQGYASLSIGEVLFGTRLF